MWDDWIWPPTRPAFKSSVRGKSLTDCDDRPRKLSSLGGLLFVFGAVCVTFSFLVGGSKSVCGWMSLAVTRLLPPGLAAMRGSGKGVDERRDA